jgi:hypothetical protein
MTDSPQMTASEDRCVRAPREEWEEDAHEGALGRIELRAILAGREAAIARFRDFKQRLLRRR